MLASTAEFGQEQSLTKPVVPTNTQQPTMQNLQEQQLVIDAELVQAMIESTPASWRQIVLTLTRPKPTNLSVDPPRSRQVGDFIHELSSPEGYPPVGPANSLFEATYKLDELLQSAHGLLVKAVYVVKEEAGKWRYQAKYEYEYEDTNR